MRDRGFSSFFLSSPGSPPLRIGILLDRSLDRATAGILGDLAAADYLTTVVVLIEAGGTDPSVADAPRSPAAATPGRLHRVVRTIRGGWRHLAWDLYEALDRRRVVLADDPTLPVDRATALDGLDVHPVEPLPDRDGTGRRLPAAAIERLRAARPDVLLQLGMQDVRGLDDIAEQGAWELRNGDGARYRGDPPYAWEMVEGSPVTTVALVRRAADPANALVLATARFAVDSSSVVRNRVAPGYGSAFLIVRELWGLHRFGPQWILEAAHPVGSNQAPGVRGGRPTNRAVVAWLMPRLLAAGWRRLAGRVTSRDLIEHWQMAIRAGGPGLALDGPPDLSGFRWIRSPKGRFFADPFVLERDGASWLFYEDYGYPDRRGVISCASVGPDGRLGPAQVVLATDAHLSYPYVFVAGGEAWMIPESSEAGSVQLYRATEFPWRWVAHAELLAEPALDTSILEEGGRWWLFTSLREPRGGATMLWLFHADSLEGPWTGHPRNPVSMDVRTARGAGRVDRHEGRLLRPSQDGSRGYGSSFGLNEITALSTTDFREQLVVAVGPDWSPGLLATHTYNRAGPIEVTDGKFPRSRRDVV